MNKIRSSGLKLNLSKCLFGIPELKFLRELVSEEGIKPDPQKVSAIKDMPPPMSKQDLKRFMGMIAYLGKFIVNLSKTTAPLHKLLENDTEWSFDKPQQEMPSTHSMSSDRSPSPQVLRPQIAHKNFVRCFQVGSRSYTGTMSRWNLASSCLCLIVTRVSRAKLLSTREINAVDTIRMQTISQVLVWSQVRGDQ